MVEVHNVEKWHGNSYYWNTPDSNHTYPDADIIFTNNNTLIEHSHYSNRMFILQQKGKVMYNRPFMCKK